ncbi:MAG: rhomboid family intramembrane serine protease [Gemmatimonadetes bacterium]|nr:rhomboid family intramembrane serine protease [Gemmatimonadota bacterium]NIQ54101.1 rhomboid family intramembrane serine protease [Gemmatimonadota bacterium]NIU74299.1 rhomboid family intramembrane serine protease [Gammaproteobacteria bacterium]NIX44304.1 rhomboid family intramembrane serine protease [Gemmatimonadota bacterium]NIY08527.1 rhomboid family intramembrane serine protease [Gemmatimonadota bacterium]
MFPLRDENPTELVPFFTFALIAANVAVWFLVQGAGLEPGVLRQSVCEYGAIPAEITGQVDPLPAAFRSVRCPTGGLTWTALVTSMFLHGGWFHLIGNMWFLWIFGNNIEDSMGHLRFLLFYLLTGLAASGGHVLSEPGSQIPTVGASGAISGVMGAYLLLYPRVRVDTLLVIVFYIRVIPLPAWIMLGYWFLIQLLSGTTTAAASAGVAFWAHIGGFVAGLVLVKLFEKKELVQAKKAHIRLDRRQIRHRGWW